MHGPRSVFFFFFYPRRLLKAIFSITYCRNLPAATTSSEVALIFNLDVMPFNQDKLMQVSRSLGSFSQLLLCFIYLLFFDLVRVAVIPTVSPIVYITFPGAITSSAILQNYSIKPANKILIHTDRFLPLQPVKKDSKRRQKRQYLQGSSVICCLTLYVRFLTKWIDNSFRESGKTISWRNSEDTLFSFFF